MRTIVYQDKEGTWRWHQKAENNKIVNESGEGFNSVNYAIESAKRYGKVSDAEIEVQSNDLG